MDPVQTTCDICGEALGGYNYDHYLANKKIHDDNKHPQTVENIVTIIAKKAEVKIEVVKEKPAIVFKIKDKVVPKKVFIDVVKKNLNNSKKVAAKKMKVSKKK